MKARALAALSVVAAGLAASSACAGAATFGTPLGTGQFTGAPNNPYDCTQYATGIAGVLPVISPTGGPATSCIWSDVTASGTNLSLGPPIVGTATVTAVRVAVGAMTGPMQVVVLRNLRQNTANPARPTVACCTPVAESQVFTPQPNTINTIPVNLPMREDAPPPNGDTTTVVAFDGLGLAVLEPGVPVPMYYTGGPDPADFLWDTATPSTVTPGFYSDTTGFWVAMDADWTASSGGGGGRPPGAPLALNAAGAQPQPASECALSRLCLAPREAFPAPALPQSLSAGPGSP